MNKYIILIISVFLLAVSASGESYHVSLKGNNANPGTLKSPFHSIQKAADVMQAGDTCYIHAGTYYETVRPARSGAKGKPIVFTAYRNDEIIVHGGRIITGWKKHKGNIYQAAISDTVKDLFFNRQYMLLARHPNMPFDQEKGFDMCRPKLGTANPPDGIDWTGVTVFCSDNDGWWNSVRKQDEYVELTDKVAGGGWLMGISGLIDSEGEWCWKDGILYFWPTGNKDPDKFLVEAKVRDCGFDLSRRNYIILNKLTVFGSTISMLGSNWCVLDDCRAYYVSSLFNTSTFNIPIREQYAPMFTHVQFDPMTTHLQGKGILVGGSHNTIRNCEIAHSWGNCVTLLGYKHTVYNNEIYDANWEGWECAVVSMNGGGHTIRRNTVHDAQRAVVLCTNRSDMSPLMEACKIDSNDIYNAGLAKADVGAIYCLLTNGNGSSIAYNWIHDSYNGYCTESHGAVGIYLDNYSSNFIVHHNVIWNVTNGPWATGFFANNPDTTIYIFGYWPNRHQIYNNTLWNCGRVITSPDKGWNGSVAQRFWAETKVFNNILLKDITFAKAVVGNNYSGTVPMFTDTLNHDFRLREGSPCIDAGKGIPGITDGFKGSAPDIGAYEYGGEYWLPGLLPNSNNKGLKIENATHK